MKRILTLIVLFTAFCSVSAQDFKGTVYYRKANGTTEPLPFAQIYYIEKQKVIEADANGQFSLETLPQDATLVATYVGYSRDTVVVSPGTPVADFFLAGENGIEESVVSGKQASLSKLKTVKTEVITAAGLCKMACCALAESFENSSSVTVGFSDAITGVRQVKLLGLSGIYTQMLDENRPVMRGLAAPFGMQYVPGQWLESIQIAKEPSSVTNGLEAITGQINVEHRKPTDETPLFIQLYGSTDAMFEGNVTSSLQLNDRWSVVNMAHVGGTATKMDHNQDGFRDEPEDLQMNFASRWLYYAPSGVQVRFGGSFVNDNRLGGQTAYEKGMYDRPSIPEIWGSEIKNKGVDGYLKVGVPLDPEQNSNIAMVADFNHYETDSFFGPKIFDGKQNMGFLNLIYHNNFNERHQLSAGLTGQYDDIHHTYSDRVEKSASAFAEYTFTQEDKFTFVGGLNLQYNSLHGWLFAPRANIKYSFSEDLILRATGGRGFRTAEIFTDNIGNFSTGRDFRFADNLDLLEDAWTYGGNLTWYLNIGNEENQAYVSFDYFHNEFRNQVISDQEFARDAVWFYNLDGRSYTNTYQADFSVDPVERFNITATFRYTDAKVTLKSQGLVERPMTSRFKGVLTLQYATPMNIWTFDFTAQLNGPMKLPNFAVAQWGMEKSPVYPILYAQVTRKFNGFDVYVGGENLTNYRQKDAIISADDPFSTSFNASCIWGPLMGIKAYAGIRFTLWK